MGTTAFMIIIIIIIIMLYCVKVALGGLQKAKSELKTLVDSVKMKTHVVDAKPHVKYLENESNRDVVRAIGNEFHGSRPTASMSGSYKQIINTMTTIN